jgi:hypothetical protein
MSTEIIGQVFLGLFIGGLGALVFYCYKRGKP